MITRRYRVRGVVQGVGFRPFIHRLARDYQLTGWVLNDTAGVLIHARGSPDDHRQFVLAIERHAPPAAVIASIETTDVSTDEVFDGFAIRASVDNGGGDTLVPPDLSVCADCRAELMEPRDRRFRYPFDGGLSLGQVMVADARLRAARGWPPPPDGVAVPAGEDPSIADAMLARS